MSQYVDVQWPVTATGHIPLNHQYHLLAAIARVVPVVHESIVYGIHPIRGLRIAPGLLQVNDKSSLVIRVPSEKIATLLPLSGKKLELAGCPIRLGVPRVHALTPYPRMYSHLVTIKGFMEPGPFAEALRRQMDKQGIGSSLEVLVGQRRVVRLKQQAIVGFRVVIDGLNDQDSIRLQEVGLGGRRHLGCGLFNPDRHPNGEKR